MKDHSKNKEDARTYILSYEVINNEIILKLASGEKYIVPYSEENEMKVIDKMENQALFCKTPTTVNDITVFQYFIGLGALWLPASGVLQTIRFINNPGVYSGIWMVLHGLGAVFCVANVLHNIYLKKDAKKLCYFIEHRRELNEKIGSSENMKLGLSKKTIKEIEKAQSTDKQPINVTNIDNYSLKELKILKANVERMTDFGFDEKTPKLKDVKVKKRELIK
jgi:hypothetical protein